MIRKITFSLAVIAATLQLAAQNKYEEILDCEIKNNKLIVSATVQGTPHKFLLDVAGNSSSVLAEHAAKNNDEEQSTLEKIGVGQNLFLQKLVASVVRDNELKKLGVIGVLGSEVFKSNVLTIDKEKKTITISAPYKPAYMSLRNRSEMTASRDKPTVSIAGKAISAPLDSLLDLGVISFDFSKAKVYFEPYKTLVRTKFTKQSTANEDAANEGAIIHLDRDAFLRDVFNFRQHNEWKYQGDMPCIVDFWATWCAPCRKLDPILKELAEEYKGRVKFYKVNVDKEREVAEGYFGINSIPVLLFVPKTGEPKKILGLDTKESIREKIEDLLQ